MGVARRIVPQILALEAIAVRILVGIFVEVGHLGGRPPARDDFDELGAIEDGLVQICSPARRARVATPVAVWAVAELAIRFFMKQPIAKGDILGGGGKGVDGGGQQGRGDELAGVHMKLLVPSARPKPRAVSLSAPWSGARVRSAHRGVLHRTQGRRLLDAPLSRSIQFWGAEPPLKGRIRTALSGCADREVPV